MKTRACSPIRSTTGSDMHVQDVMTRGVLSIQKFESIMHVAQILSERNISGLPVVDKKNHVIGIITQADILSIMGIRKENTFKDLLKLILGESLPECKMGDFVGDVMTSPAATITPQATITDVVRMMDEKSIRRLPVVDDNNVLVGIISRADILKAVIKKLT
ncbi:MAG: CBS domain-containing protein [Nitrospirae bacterium]|nr:CBS domain-containing protein [Nitrospirota bacterium]